MMSVVFRSSLSSRCHDGDDTFKPEPVNLTHGTDTNDGETCFCCVCCQLCIPKNETHGVNATEFFDKYTICSQKCSLKIPQTFAFIQGFIFCTVLSHLINRSAHNVNSFSPKGPFGPLPTETSRTKRVSPLMCTPPSAQLRRGRCALKKVKEKSKEKLRDCKEETDTEYSTVYAASSAGEVDEMTNPASPVPPSTHLSGGWCGAERVEQEQELEAALEVCNAGSPRFDTSYREPVAFGDITGITPKQGTNKHRPSQREMQQRQKSFRHKRSKSISRQPLISSQPSKRIHANIKSAAIFNPERKISFFQKSVLQSTTFEIAPNTFVLTPSSTQLHRRQCEQNNVESESTSLNAFDSEIKTESWNCSDCGKSFCTTKTLKAHLKMKHKKDLSSNKVCRICGQGFLRQAGLSLHMTSKHRGEKAVECESCGERFSSSMDCDRHVALVHGKERGVCHICGKHFKYIHTLQAHVRAHTGIRAFVCEFCGKGFLRQTTLIDHKKRHFCKECKQKLIQCKCPKPEKTRIVVEANGAFQCKFCAAVLETLDLYESHVTAHKLEWPYGCPLCDKRFKGKTGLRVHMFQHREKQFQCDVCHKTFTYKCNLKHHRKNHDVEGRPHSCNVCQKMFKTEAALKVHERTHFEERHVNCHICGRSLSRLSNLKRHLRVMHPEYEPKLNP